jgi:hypothetical protein
VVRQLDVAVRELGRASGIAAPSGRCTEPSGSIFAPSGSVIAFSGSFGISTLPTPLRPLVMSPIFDRPAPAAFPTYVIGSITRPALPATDKAFATAPALPAPAAAAPSPPVKTVVTTLKVTAPAARAGFLPHSSHATSALPVSFIVFRDSRNHDGKLSSGSVQNSSRAPGIIEIVRPVASCARPFHAWPIAAQPFTPTSVPRPLIVPQIPSTTMPSHTNDFTQWPMSYQWCFSSTGSPQGSLAFFMSAALNPYWSLRSEPSPATICVPCHNAVILL